MRIRTDHQQRRTHCYITPGKWYEVIHKYGTLCRIIDDYGMKIYTDIERSQHLDFVGSWEIEE